MSNESRDGMTKIGNWDGQNWTQLAIVGVTHP